MTSQYSDHTRPLNRALRFGTLALGVIVVVSLAGWGYARDLPGIWGVVIGAAIGGSFVLTTALSVRLTAHSTPANTMAVVLGSWLLKIVVLIVVLVILRPLAFYDTLALFSTVVAVLVVVLAGEVWGIVTTNVTFTGSD
ncbi:hypothetical protein [Corynebacterium uterequi]|uniref:hypothetical protein n=1 Tax=Corynebacterium uterequi TaxID=1072256 RepID=UPI0009E1CC00|nr:hypothetical protein [Corynebacterium uterequi]